MARGQEPASNGQTLGARRSDAPDISSLFVLPARCLPHFRGLAGTYSYKNKPISLKKAACLPPKRLSRATAGSHFSWKHRPLPRIPAAFLPKLPHLFQRIKAIWKCEESGKGTMAVMYTQGSSQSVSLCRLLVEVMLSALVLALALLSCPYALRRSYLLMRNTEGYGQACYSDAASSGQPAR
jgi:hypothetical protein